MNTNQTGGSHGNSSNSMEARIARLEQMQEEDRANMRTATMVLGAGLVITAFGVRAANRRRTGTSVHVPNGYSLTALPPSTNR